MVCRVQEEKQPTCISNHTGAGVTSEKNRVLSGARIRT